MKKLVLPAAEEAFSIWTNKFGFRKVNEEQVSLPFDLSSLSGVNAKIFSFDTPNSDLNILS